MTSSDARFAYDDLTAVGERAPWAMQSDKWAELGRRIVWSSGFAWPYTDWDRPGYEGDLFVVLSGITTPPIKIGNPRSKAV